MEDLERLAREYGKPLPDGFQEKVLQKVREREKEKRLEKLRELSNGENAPEQEMD